MIAFTVPGSPLSQNRAWRIVRMANHATLVLTPEAKAYKAEIAAKAATNDKHDGPVRVELDFYFDSERPDLDGPIKLVLDALQGVTLGNRRGKQTRIGGCIANDRCVRELAVRRFVDRDRPRLEVVVRAVARGAA